MIFMIMKMCIMIIKFNFMIGMQCITTIKINLMYMKIGLMIVKPKITTIKFSLMYMKPDLRGFGSCPELVCPG